jgi:type VI secretion system protein ImpE
VLAGQDAKAVPGLLVDRSAIHAERTRQQMFRDGILPARSGAVSADRPGVLNGTPFGSLRDADERIGDNIEVFIAGSYTWVPTRYIMQLEIDAPVTLRDLIWARARLEVSPDFRVQDLGEVLLPVLAPLSYLAEDHLVKLGRVSIWEPASGADGSDRLLGQKMLQVNGEEFPMLEVRSVTWAPAADADGMSTDATA